MTDARPASRGSGALSWGLSALFLVCAVLALAMVRLRSDGARAVAGSEAALARGDQREAIVLARSAAEAACIGSPFPAIGYARLEKIARDAESRGDLAVAAAAWRGMRAAAVSTRALGLRTDVHRAAAEEGLARIGARASRPGEGGGPTDPALSEASLREMQSHAEIPSSLGVALLAAGAIAFAAGALRLVWGPGRAHLRSAAITASVGAALCAVACALA